jgi:two-component system, NarL family, nitrate/nitrite response regulator NarL
MSADALDRRAGSEPTRVLIVEDHAILSQSLSLSLRLEGMEPHHASGLDARSVLADARRVQPHLVLLDLHLGGEDALPMIGPLAAKGIQVLILTGSTDEALHGAALDAGAVSILHKGESLDQLCQSIRDVVDGHTVMRPARRDELLRSGRRRGVLEAKLRTLSPREGDVLGALIEGMSAETIASEQFVSVGTTRSHIRSILRKLDVTSQLGAVAAARRACWALASSASPTVRPVD